MSTKVRIACRRCRAKRIKCDGGVPACGNCQKAGEACVDVDGRNKTLHIPRDFAANARARIEWLEEHIKTLAPELDLSRGPRVDFGFLDALGTVPSPNPQDAMQHTHEFPFVASKRTYSSISEPPSRDLFADEARSVALDLGLLTLNSDSRQTHYLGTSSGRLFTSLIGAGSPEMQDQTRTNLTSSRTSFSCLVNTGPFAFAKHTKQSCRLLYESLRKALPSEADASILLGVYFRNIHPDHPFLHPSSLFKAVDALYGCATADISAEIGYNGWVDSVQPFSYNGELNVSRNNQCTPISVFTATFHVFMVFTLAATVRTRQRTYDFAPDQFYRIAMSTSQHCFSSTSLFSLQATLLLAVHSLLSPAELNIWTLTYVAMAHCVDLGLHRAPIIESGLSSAALLTRKMLFFSVYHLDRSIAAIQGRPLGIRDETFDVQLPTFEDVKTDAMALQDAHYLPAVLFTDGLAFSIHRFKLDPIISEIKIIFYHLPSQVSAYARPNEHQSSQAAIQQKLGDWRRDLLATTGALPTESEDDQLEHRKYLLKLTSQYFAAMVLLHQPSQAIPQPNEQSLMICYQCASSRLNTYNDLYSTDSFYQSWRSVQGVFSSGATMIYCLWTSTLVRNTVTISEATKDLRACMNLLSVGGEWWPSVKKGKESFVRAMDALLKKLDTAQRHGNINAMEGCQPPSRRNRTDVRPQQDTPFFDQSIEVEAGTVLPDPHQGSQDPLADVTHFPDMFSDLATTDWTILDDPTFHYDSRGLLGEFPDPVLNSTDSTVEAFITEILKNDTAWNLF